MRRCFPIIDDDEPYGYDGIERTCTECGEPLMVSRSEEYQIHVFHPDCLEVIRERNEARRRVLPSDAA